MRKERKRWKKDCVKLLRLLRDADSMEFVTQAILTAKKIEAKRNASKQATSTAAVAGRCSITPLR